MPQTSVGGNYYKTLKFKKNGIKYLDKETFYRKV
jgi:hypothetical protein